MLNTQANDMMLCNVFMRWINKIDSICCLVNRYLMIKSYANDMM